MEASIKIPLHLASWFERYDRFELICFGWLFGSNPSVRTDTFESTLSRGSLVTWRALLASILFFLRVDRFASMNFSSFVSCATTQFASMDSNHGSIRRGSRRAKWIRTGQNLWIRSNDLALLMDVRTIDTKQCLGVDTRPTDSK